MTSQIGYSTLEARPTRPEGRTPEQHALRVQRRAVVRERDLMVQRWIVAGQSEQTQEDPNRAMLVESLAPSERAAIAAVRAVCNTPNLLACTLGAALLSSYVTASDQWLRHLSGRYTYDSATRTLSIEPMTLGQRHRFGLATLLVAPCAAAWGALSGLLQGAQTGFVAGCESLWQDVMRKPQTRLWGTECSSRQAPF